MSRHKFKARDKVSQKMSRDGLVEENAVTGDKRRISSRESELALRHDLSESQSYSQLGNSFCGNQKKAKKAVYRQADQSTETNVTDYTTPLNEPQSYNYDSTMAQAYIKFDSKTDLSEDKTYSQVGNRTKKTAYQVQESIPEATTSNYTTSLYEPQPQNNNIIFPYTENEQISDKPDLPRSKLIEPDNKGKFKARKNTAYREKAPTILQTAPIIPLSETPKKYSQYKNRREILAQHNKTEMISDSMQSVDASSQKQGEASPDKTPYKSKTQNSKSSTVSENKYVVTVSETPDTPKVPVDETKPPPELDNNPDVELDGKLYKELDIKLDEKSDDKPDSSLKPEKTAKLKFTEDEVSRESADVPENPKKNRSLAKAERQAERAGEKLEKARDNIPTKKKLRSERVFDENKGKAKRKLYFEKETKSQCEHSKAALPLRPVKAVANTAIVYGHRKIYQVERENVATEAAHKAEIFAEGSTRSALHFHKTSPYRKVAKLEKQAAKKSVKLSYQKALADNSKLKGSRFSRMMQNRKIKKDYAKAARQTRKAAINAKNAGSVTARAAKAVGGIISRHPVATTVIALIALLLFLLMSLVGLGSGISSSGLSGLLAGSYLAENAEIDAAELAYSELETELLLTIENTESNNPGYNEYRYEIGAVGHNPFELMAYLTSVYQDFSYNAVSGDLENIFNEQYKLTYTPSVEIRQTTDGEGNTVSYEWHILTVKLESKPFNDIILPKIDGDVEEHYNILSETKGARQFVASPFNFNWISNITCNYGWRVHPVDGTKNFHRGIDIGLPAGTEIHSGHGGTVIFSDDSGDYGNLVIVQDANGLVTKYAHCDSLLVSVGETVTAGQVIATVGNTGVSTGSHLHMEVINNGEYMNPLYYVYGG